MDALIGHTGFVGSNLLAQRPFQALFNSRNIADIRGQRFGLVACAGVPAAKWLANKDPEADWANISGLLGHLDEVQTDRFLLISTIDVYPAPHEVTEADDPAGQPNHAYGRHRLAIEEFVRQRFPNHCILRLPGLFGTGLKKNVLYDLLHDNCLEMINPEGRYQYYCLDNMAADAARAMDLGLRLLNVACEPIATQEIIDRFFPGKAVGAKANPAAAYGFRSIHSRHWGRPDGFLYAREQVLQQLTAFYAREQGKTL